MSEPRISMHGTWSSKLGFILATTGAAVGLGNIWMFPYMAGTEGGGAFVLIFLACVILIGIPACLAEMVIGRHGKCNPAESMAHAAVEAGHSVHWKWAGWFAMSSLILMLSFYSVVSGWSLAYLNFAIRGVFNHASVTQIQQLWTHFSASPWQMLAWHTAFMVLICMIVAHGVQRGIERISLIKMPLLFLLLIVLAIYGMTLPGRKEALHFLFSPNFHQLTPMVFVSALGQALFSMAVGAGCMMAYGSYVSQHMRLARGVWIITLLNVLVAILSGLAIFPIVFSHHLTPASGPALMYLTLPVAFANLGTSGQVLAILFFVLLFFAAITSAMSLAEPLVVSLMEKCHLKRTAATIIVGFFAWILGIGSILSFNLWQNVKLLGRWTIFDLATGIPTKIILPLGALSFVILAGWVMKSVVIRHEASLLKGGVFNTWRWLMRYLVPVAIVVIMLGSFF